ncbi:hypothetical protein Tco_0195302 [Tanacetum coccineum]
MCTYLKNMEEWKPKNLKNKSFANIQELFDKAMKRVSTFVDYRTELVEEKQENAKKQKVDEDKETTELQSLIEVVLDDEEEVAIDVVPLATKPPTIVDWLKLLRSERPLLLVLPRAMFPSVLVMTTMMLVLKFRWSLISALLLLSLPQGTRARDFVIPAAEGPNTQGRSLRMLFIGTSSLFLLVYIMPHIPKVELPGIEKFASLSGLESQVSGLQRQVTGLNDKLSSSDVAFAKYKANGKEKKKKIKSLTKSLNQLNARHAVELIESIVTLVSLSLELLSNTILSSFAALFEPNKEWVNAMVDGPDNEMIGGTGNGEKGDGSIPSSVVDEEAAATPSGV